MGNSPEPKEASGKQRRRRGVRRTATIATTLERGAAASCVGEKACGRWDRDAAEAAIYGGAVLGRHGIAELVAEADTASARDSVRLCYYTRKEKAP